MEKRQTAEGKRQGRPGKKRGMNMGIIWFDQSSDLIPPPSPVELRLKVLF